MFKIPDIEVLPGGRKIRALPPAPTQPEEEKPKRVKAKPDPEEAETADEE